MDINAQLLGLDEDWRGVTNPAKRRKLQNRLNQREYRRRKNLQKNVLSGNIKSPQNDPIPTNGNGEGEKLPKKPARFSDTLAKPTPEYPHTEYSVLPMTALFVDEELRPSLLRVVAQAQAAYKFHTPVPRHLPLFMKLNVFAAMAHNSIYLGFGAECMDDEGALSPFAPPAPCRRDGPQIPNNIPPGLAPTEIQKRIPHQACFDLLPYPRMRDNALLLMSSVEEDQWMAIQDGLCEDLCDVDYELRIAEGGGDVREVEEDKKSAALALSQPRLLVWGQSWDPLGWEVSPSFVKKWTWLLKGCDDLRESTNIWRARRGEEALVWEVEEDNREW